MSTQAVYWPESACSTAGSQGRDVAYLVPATTGPKTSTSFVGTPTLMTISSAEASAAAATTTASSGGRKVALGNCDWPIQTIQCRSMVDDPTVYYYNVITRNLQCDQSTAPVLRRSSDATDLTGPPLHQFELVIRNSVVLHNQLPISINYVLPVSGTGVHGNGGGCHLRNLSRVSRVRVSIVASA